ncbi:LysM repeat protein [Bacillus mesophilus]|uniref:LysM peptidoglycan-binding domain-containing protein n=1 Tax=Bacillus mesophilus TaxID=1808955 RepID=A0A6M0QD96_9BACI|nr:LysM domain-containing protein [Bacillus mesophilus]MBM7660094.1 LysM repeat protein [Bacillus mesophilus]NEY73749.1 LysM peptidoglycan-binding domain-containing protein [Bacillus mesophilus]
MRKISKILVPTFVLGLILGGFGLAANASTVTVQPNDTFWGIAQEHDVTVDELKEWNSELDPTAIPVGTEVVISKGESSDNRVVTHVVQPGNTLSEIAQVYDGVTLDRLYDLNEGIDPLTLAIGSEVIVVHESNSTTGHDVVYHTVQPGNTFYEIASVYDGVSVDEIITANPNVDPYFLQVGSEITIPLK